MCRLRPPRLSSRSRCRSCSTISEDDEDDEEGDYDDKDDAFDDVEHHLVGLDQQLAVVDDGQA